MYVRGKPIYFTKHAFNGMAAERPPIKEDEVRAVLEAPDDDDGGKAFKAVGRRTVLVYYDDREGAVFIDAVSATRRRLSP